MLLRPPSSCDHKTEKLILKKSQQTPKLTFKGRMENGRDVISARPQLKEEIVFLSGGLEAGRLDCFCPPPSQPTLVLQFARPKSDFQQLLFSRRRLNVPAGITGGIDGSLWIINDNGNGGGGGDRQVFHLSLTWK